ncbi:MAG: hypothetical protein ISS43_01380 [Candidatus Omnitrophica bacterium]|nr:hypothetical protein [Candidatus Omnitrophota bacterium]
MVDLKKVCKSVLNLKIISFFYENPATVDTPRGIAAWLSHDQKEIKKALDYLVSQNILIAHRTRSTIAYCLTQDKKIVDQIERFLETKQ